MLVSCSRSDPAPTIQSTQAPQRPATRAELDSLASWRAPLTPAQYHDLRGWSFGAPDSSPMALAPRARALLSTAGALIAVDSAAPGEVLSFAPNGTAIGRMQRENELVARFALTTGNGRLLWSHGSPSRGHHFYQVGAGGRLVIGHSSSTAHPGKPGTVGTLTFYDSLGEARGRFQCASLGATEIAPDAAATLVECRDSALVVVDRQGRTVTGLPGSFRNFRLSSGGRLVAAVPLDQPASLVLLSTDSVQRTQGPRRVTMPAVVRQVAIDPGGEYAVVTAGPQVLALQPASGAELWRVQLDGANPLPSSLSLGPGGLVAVGAVLDGSRALAGAAGPHGAIVALIRNGQLVRTLRFELDSLNAWVPSVALDPAGRALMIWDRTAAWTIDLARLAPQGGVR